MEKLKQQLGEKYEQIARLRLQKNSYYDLQRFSNEVVDILNEMHNLAESEEDKLICHTAILDVSHTIGKEVYFAEMAYKEMNKKNAAKVRIQEYFKALENAISHIYLNILILLPIKVK